MSSMLPKDLNSFLRTSAVVLNFQKAKEEKHKKQLEQDVTEIEQRFGPLLDVMYQEKDMWEYFDWTLKVLSGEEMDWGNSIWDRGYLKKSEEDKWWKLQNRFPEKFRDLARENFEILTKNRPPELV